MKDRKKERKKEEMHRSSNACIKDLKDDMDEIALIVSMCTVTYNQSPN